MSDVLSTAATDTITTMAFGRKVLMIGTEYGQDILALANSAQVLVAMTLPRGDGLMEAIPRTTRLHQALAERRLGTHVLLHAVPWDQALAVYLVDQYDLAVINPHALGEDAPGELIATAAQYAESIIVIETPGRNLWDVVTAAVAGSGMLCSGDGSIIVARPMPVEPTVRRD